MESIVIIVHVLVAIGITGLVLIQQGKGADMGASFGSGASQTIFGSVGSGNALTKSTSWLATIFFVTSLVLALYAKQQAAQGIQAESLLQNPDQIPAAVVPALQQDIPVAAAADPASDIPQVDDAAVEAAVQEALSVAEEALDAAQGEAEQAVDAVEETGQELQDAAGNN